MWIYRISASQGAALNGHDDKLDVVAVIWMPISLDAINCPVNACLGQGCLSRYCNT